ncbi:MAG: mechanosensitive ion channel [Methylovulum sp.]|nr:mechanosensitive ion channel [Methylovulum sp.]
MLQKYFSASCRRVVHARWAGFFLVILFIFGEPAYCLVSVERTVAPPQSVDAQIPKESATDKVLIGLHVNRLFDVNDSARSFTAEFDLWLRFRGAFDPNDLLLLDTLKPLALDHPDEVDDRDGEHFRLFHLNPTLRFGMDKKDLAGNVRRLSIQLGRRNHPTVPFQLITDREGMGLDRTDGSWGQILRDDEVLSGDAGWAMQSGELRSVSVNMDQRIGRKPEPEMIASITVRKVVVSPRAIIAALLPPRLGNGLALGALAVVASLLAGTWLRSARRIPRRPIVLIRLLMGTLGLYLFESWTMTTATEQLTLDACRNILILFECLWWLVPAIWIDMLLPPFVWEPISQRTGSPVSSISRMLVKVSVYALALVLAMNFVYADHFGNILAASGVLGIILGFALQSLILDAFAGLMLNIEQPFKILQWVKLEHRDIGQLVGQVLEMNWRATRLWTRDNDIISIPNSYVSKAKITNYAMPTAASRLEFIIVLDYSIPPARARQLLKQGAQRAADSGKVLINPEPDVVVVATDDTGIRYKIRFYANLALVSDSGALTDAVDGVMSRLAEEGIDPSSPPQRVLFERTGAITARRPDAEPSRERELLVPTARQDTPGSSPISPDQVGIIQHTWSLVRPIADDAARMFYERLFQLDPSLKPMFHTEPKAQRIKLIGMLSLVVKGIGNLDNLMGTIQELGMRHVNYGVQDAHYDTVGAALLWTLEQGLGKEWTPEAKVAWSTAYGVLSSAMKSAGQVPYATPKASVNRRGHS